MRKILSLVIISLLLPLLVGAVTSQISWSNAQSSSSEGIDFSTPLEAKNTRIVTKTTLPSPSALSETKGPPSWANGGGGNDKDEGAATGTLGSSISSTSYAIVIGIADYPSSEDDLKYTDDDARQVKTTLTDIYDFEKSNITTLIDATATDDAEVPNATATFSNIKRAVNDLPAGENDEVVFFFSGHGGSGDAEDGDNEDTDESIIVNASTSSTTVHLWDGQLRDWFSDVNAARITFGFDSCLAGGMDDVGSSNRIVAAAANETGTAYEFDDFENGQFTYYFFEEGMEDGNANTHDYEAIDEDEPATVEEAYDYTDESYHPRYKKDGPAINDQFENDLLLGTWDY